MNGTYSLPSAPPAREANRDIIFMMLPLLVVACYLYGGRPAVMCCVAVATAVVCDHLTAWMRGRTHDSAENSSIPMALVTTMMLPASVSYYIVIVAVAVGVVLGKEAFGGWGEYPFNPSALGYAVVAVSWPQQVFRYPAPFTQLTIASTQNATLVESPAMALRVGGTPNLRALDLVLGNYAGAIGTTSVLVIIACALYLWVRRDITVSIPAGFFLSIVCVAFFFPRIGDVGLAWPWQELYMRYQSVKYELLTGTLLFAGVFLVNEPVTRPRVAKAHFAYGLLMGFMAMMFRYFGTYDNSVCFAVLGVNALTGFLDKLFTSRQHRKGGVAR